MSTSGSEDVKLTLQKPDVHDVWEDAYRTPENERFYEEAFDYIRSVLQAPANATILDAGCGIGAHSVRLAKRGFTVQAVDFSESVLRSAEPYLQASGYRDRIRLQREDLLAFSFPDETFDYVLCWGVLMHIPDVDRALAELCRVLKRGGMLVLSECNVHSVQALAARVQLALGNAKTTTKSTPAGREYWTMTPAGTLLTRLTNFRWLANRLESSGFTIRKRVACQFTELYTKFRAPAPQKLIHRFNGVWFRYVSLPYLAFGNLLIARKNP